MSRQLLKETVIAAPPSDVWIAWTTSEGAMSFFAPEAEIELRHGGLYELYFDTDAPPGLKGSEGCRIISYDSERMLSFTWNAPPAFPAQRNRHTQVTITLRPTDGNATGLQLTHSGWDQGEEWDNVYAYFDQAWNIVLDRLNRRFEQGPVDWDTE